jgi:hypothetical protein
MNIYMNDAEDPPVEGEAEQPPKERDSGQAVTSYKGVKQVTLTVRAKGWRLFAKRMDQIIGFLQATFPSLQQLILDFRGKPFDAFDAAAHLAEEPDGAFLLDSVMGVHLLTRMSTLVRSAYPFEIEIYMRPRSMLERRGTRRERTLNKLVGRSCVCLEFVCLDRQRRLSIAIPNDPIPTRLLGLMVRELSPCTGTVWLTPLLCYAGRRNSGSSA